MSRNGIESSWQVFAGYVKRRTGLDRAIAFVVITKVWAAVIGIVTILLIARYLSPAEQGYYYTFNSVMALQVLFELGFSVVILQLASHERARLSLSLDGRVEGDPVAHSRLSSVLRKAVRWYTVGAFLMAATLLPAGLYFFSAHQQGGVEVSLRTPWCFLVLGTVVTFQVSPIFSFLEGCGYVAEVACSRMGQSIVGTLLACGVLVGGHGLFAPAMLIGGQASVGLIWLYCYRKLLIGLFTRPIGANQIHWREIWPFQWRIAVSWLCGYFIFQALNPILFVYQGPVVAGQMGMSLTINTAITGLSLAWMSTKASPFGRLIACGNIAELDRLFFRTLKQSAVLLLACMGTFLACLMYVEQHHPKLAGRVLPPWAFALLLAGAFLGTHIVACEAIYLRAHKQEPFLVPTIVAAVLVSLSTYVLARTVGVGGVAVGYCCCGIFGFFLCTYVFITKRRKWHETLPLY
jgi:O-antigen/teichoic acid export membrane protein